MTGHEGQGLRIREFSNPTRNQDTNSRDLTGATSAFGAGVSVYLWSRRWSFSSYEGEQYMFIYILISNRLVLSALGSLSQQPARHLEIVTQRASLLSVWR